MLIKDIREKEETYLYRDIKPGCCFMCWDVPFIKAYYTYDDIDHTSSRDEGKAVNIKTGEIVLFDYDVEVLPVVIEAIIK